MLTGSFFLTRGPGRIAISRSVPRFLRGKIPEYPHLAPPQWMHGRFEGDPDKWARCYSKVVLAKLDARQVCEDLHTLADGAEPILLCWEHEPAGCHRRIVAEFLAEAIGEPIPETEPVKPRPAQLDLFAA